MVLFARRFLVVCCFFVFLNEVLDSLMSKFVKISRFLLAPVSQFLVVNGSYVLPAITLFCVQNKK